MITVSVLAGDAGVTADTVRHYVKLGLLRPDHLGDNGYKIFLQSDVDRIQFIRNAQSLGFTLKEIATIISYSKDKNSPCPQVRDTLKKHIVENQKKLDELRALQQQMENALDLWKDMPDGIPDGNSVCHLIESIARSQSSE